MPHRVAARAALALAAAGLTAGPASAQTITALGDATKARSGLLTIDGTDFGDAPGRVEIGGIDSFIGDWSDTRIRAYVPESAALGPNDVVVIAGSISNTVGLDVTLRPPADGRIAWRFEVAADYTLHRAGFGPDGTVYFDDVRGRLYAVAPDGGLNWVFDTLLGVQGGGSRGPVAVLADGTAVVATRVAGLPKTLVAVRPDGTLRWTFTVPSASGWLAGPGVGPQGNVYAAMNIAQAFGNPYDVLALSPDGEVLWTCAADPALFEDAVIGTELMFGPSEPGGPIDQLICNADMSAPGGTYSGQNFAFALADGEQRFTVNVGGINSNFQQAQTQLAVNPTTGDFYMTEFGGSGSGWGLQAFSPTGERGWRYDPGILAAASEPEVAPDGTILFAWDLGSISAVTPDGDERWLIDTDDWLEAPVAAPTQPSFVVIGAEGIGERHYVQMRDLDDAAVRWEQTIDDAEGALATTNTKPRFTPDGGRLYFTGETMFDPGPTTFILFAVDATERAAGDADGDGDADVDDLLAVLLAWGACPAPPEPCPADLNDDGAVDVDDLLVVLSSWTG